MRDKGSGEVESAKKREVETERGRRGAQDIRASKMKIRWIGVERSLI
jgi:hypothetical protein